MFRIVCTHCHIPLNLKELELVEVRDWTSLICPECGCVLVTADAAHADLEALQEAHAGA